MHPARKPKTQIVVVQCKKGTHNREMKNITNVPRHSGRTVTTNAINQNTKNAKIHANL